MRRLRQTRHQPMGDFIDDILDVFRSGPPKVPFCESATQEATADIVNRLVDVELNWKPLPVYTGKQLGAIVDSGLSMLREAAILARTEASELQLQSHRDYLNRLVDKVQKVMTDSLVFSNARREGLATGVDRFEAAGLKRWVLDAMRAARDAIGGTALIQCAKPFFFGALETFMAVFDVFWSVVKTIGGVVLAAGEKAIKIADNIGLLMNVAFWGSLGFGVWWLAGKPGLDQIQRRLR